MTPGDRVARLEGLLDRIQKNNARPRARRAAVPSAAPAPVPVARAAAAPSTPAPRTPAPPAPPTPSPAVAAPPAPRAPLAETPPPPPWPAEPASTVQARPSSIPPEELSEDDLVEVTTLPPPEAPAVAASPSSVPAEGELEEPPASSKRSKVAESLDQAIANAAAQVDEHEVPIHTPPPESGPQEAVLPTGLEAPRAPEFAELARPISLGPTPEQLGETIELEEPEGPSIEIEVAGLPAPEPKIERPAEELEVTLPRAEMPSGTYDVSGPEEAAPIVPPAMPTHPAAQQLTLARPAAPDADVARVVRAGEKPPENFGELLEATLAL